MFAERKERKREDRNNRSPIRAAKNGLLAPANTGTLCGRPLRRTASARTTDSIRSFRLDQRAMPKCTVTTMTGHFLRNNETNASSSDTKEHLQQIAEKENVDMRIQMLQMPETTFKQPESPVGPLLNRNHFHEHFDTDAYLRVGKYTNSMLNPIAGLLHASGGPCHATGAFPFAKPGAPLGPPRLAARLWLRPNHSRGSLLPANCIQNFPSRLFAAESG